jgi:hypothetical protein
MKLATHTTRVPHLIGALEALAARSHHEEAARILLEELAGITVLVATRFTNDRTADGLLEAYYLTTGCLSLALCQAPADDASRLAFLLHHGAEHVFQMGFRQIKELSALPAQTLVTEFDNDPHVQQRTVKALFAELCRADPNAPWMGDEAYRKERLIREENQQTIECANWLRKQHFAGPVRDSDLDANAVIAIAVIFAISGDGRIHARTAQQEIERLIKKVRQTRPDSETGWQQLLDQMPPAYQAIVRDRMDELKNTIIKKILSKTPIAKVIAEIQNCYAGTEQDIDFH